jgi:hypothetical protein
MGMFDVNLDRVFKNNKLEADGVLIMPRYLLDLLLIWLLTWMTSSLQELQ